jgi:DNA-directed RNA polymerase sigma subunit (sigma70/sigma32)
MTREDEQRLGEGIEQAWQRIRLRVCQLGMAATWHLGKAREVLRDPARLKRHVLLLKPEEAAIYLAALPQLVQRTEEQDARCTDLWARRATLSARAEFDGKQARLIELFLRFQYPHHAYERLVRQDEKPLLDDVRRALAQAVPSAEQVSALEMRLRMGLLEYVALETAHADDLRTLDQLRAELVAAHEDLARSVAEQYAGTEPDALFFARCGLRRAAEYYEVSRGYRFAPYAIWWIRQAIAARNSYGRKKESLG